MNDVRALVARAQAGDARALERLYVLHVGPIRAFLAARVGNRHDAEDLTSETFARMVASLPDYEPGSAPFAAWLYRIARNLAVDHARRGSRAASPTAVHRGHAPSAEEEGLGSLDRERVVGLVRRLPRGQRHVVALRVLLGRSTAEAAATLACTEGAVKALQHRALSTLARRAAA